MEGKISPDLSFVQDRELAKKSYFAGFEQCIVPMHKAAKMISPNDAKLRLTYLNLVPIVMAKAPNKCSINKLLNFCKQIVNYDTAFIVLTIIFYYSWL